jgi:hypothetical protein
MTKLSMSEEEMLKRKYTRPYEKRIADLEKENSELKESLKKWKDAIYADVENYDKQFTKAKKIIKNLMVFAEMDDREYEKEYKEAEQFLKEEPYHLP